MPVFSAPDFDRHENLLFAHDPESGLRAIIAIHNTNRGPALGGTRMWPYASEEEALADVLRLSRGMTYKAAILGLDFGGGKAVIMGDPRRDKSPALLRAYGRFVQSLGGRYHTAEDVGLTVGDMEVIRRETPHAHGLPDGTGEPSPATARGVLRGIQAAIQYRLGRGLDGARVAVQGLGSVGYRLCGYLAEAGATLLVSDLDDAKMKRAMVQFGAVGVDPDAIHAVQAEVFAPCALGGVINDQTIPEIQAPIVAGAANNQLAAPRHGAALSARNILYAPDYVINAGGLIDIAGEIGGWRGREVMAQVDRIQDRLMDIFRRAERQGLPPDRVADTLAEARFMGGDRQEPSCAA